ncbi:unnamed protein product [Lota lota]
MYQAASGGSECPQTVEYVIFMRPRWGLEERPARGFEPAAAVHSDKPMLAPQSLLMEDLESLMSHLNNWNFPIFSLVEKTNGK